MGPKVGGFRGLLLESLYRSGRSGQMDGRLAHTQTSQRNRLTDTMPFVSADAENAGRVKTKRKSGGRMDEW